MTTTTTTVNSTVHAADELIAVTGEKSLPKQWALADALLQASPNIHSHELAAVRQAAVDKAGHDEFWKVARLRQLARTANSWPVTERIADVSLDAHLEARRNRTLAEAQKLIADAGKTAKVQGKPSIREIRAEAGANGVTATPPRVDKADGAELFKRLILKKKELADYLRKNLRTYESEIVAFAALFAEAETKAKALAGKAKAPASTNPTALAPKAERKQRVKGL